MTATTIIVITAKTRIPTTTVLAVATKTITRQQ
jgi:hypothetical protein